MATETPVAPDAAAEPKKKGFRFPTAFTVLFFVLLLVWGLTFVIKPGAYGYVSCDGGNAKPIPGSYQETTSELSFADRVYDLLLSPVNGLYGIRVPPESVPAEEVSDQLREQAVAACGDTGAAEVVSPPGSTGPYNSGDMAGAVQVFFFVLCIGAFITVTMKTGALDAGIARVTHRFRERGLLLILILMAIFSLGGTTYGMAEETLGFYALLVPIMVGIGFDRMVGAVTIMVGAGVGTLASTVNPFATGVASSAADIPLGDGIGLRLLMYVVLTVVAVLYVLRYARKVKADPAASLVAGNGTAGLGEAALEELDAAAVEEPPLMTGRQRAVLWVFMGTFALMIFSVIPWGDFFPGMTEPLSKVFMPWYFPELAALFLIMSIVVGLIGGLGEEGMVSSIVTGMGDFMGAALIIAIARGVTTIMNNAGITDTVLHSLESVVADLSSYVFAIMMFVVNVPLAFLVPSSSGHATLAMPIMAPLGDFAGVSRAIVVTAYQSASGWVNLFTPTSAIVMGGLALAKVGYDKYIRFVWPLLVILFVLVCGFLALGVAVPALGGTVG